jgi:Flp pilus assembly protein TadG
VVSRRASRRVRGQRGVSTIEFAILAPSIMAFIFITIQTVLFLYGRSVALNAAQEGVSQLRLVQPSIYTPAIGAKVRADTLAYAQQVGGNALTNAKVDPPVYDAAEGIVSVTVSGEAVSLWPGLKLKTTRTASSPIEEFEADR